MSRYDKLGDRSSDIINQHLKDIKVLFQDAAGQLVRDLSGAVLSMAALACVGPKQPPDLVTYVIVICCHGRDTLEHENQRLIEWQNL